jgi:hypothetical protein
MFTIAETEFFTELAKPIWREDERAAFCSWLAGHPYDGDVIPGSGGCRKIRWARKGMGKSGGCRVIYLNRLDEGKIWLLVIYTKNQHGNIPAKLLKQIKEEIENGEKQKHAHWH